MLQPMGLNATTFMKEDPWNVFETASHAGLKAVELTAGRSARAMIRANSDFSDVERAQCLAKAHGTAIHALGMHRDVSQTEQLDEFMLLLEKAARLHCDIGTIGVPDKCDLPAFMDGLNRAAERAKALGITICLETHGYEHGSGVSLLPVLSAHPDLRICYDTGNVLFYSDATPAEDLPQCADKVGHVHLKDKIGGKGKWNFPALGEGEVLFPQLLTCLNAPLPGTIEIEFTPDGASLDEIQRAVNASVRYLKEHSILG